MSLTVPAPAEESMPTVSSVTGALGREGAKEATMHGGFWIRQLGRVAPGVRRGLLVTVVAGAVLASGLPASANGPESGADPSVTMTVSPSDNLLDGQSVYATGSGWPTFADGIIRQCGITAAGPQCDQAVAGQFKTGAAPVLPKTLVQVKRYVNTGTTTFNCGVQACALVATAGGKTSQHHIAILGAGTSSSIDEGPATTAGTMDTTTSTSPATTVPSPTTTVAGPGTAGLVCNLLTGLRGILGGLLAGLFDSLLTFFGCPPVA
jgi:hypothetical protein